LFLAQDERTQMVFICLFALMSHALAPWRLSTVFRCAQPFLKN
jgi:hypothetical protein